MREGENMFIGILNEKITPQFYLANTSISYPPEKDSGGYVYRWGNLFDCAVDIKYKSSDELLARMCDQPRRVRIAPC